MKGFLGTSLELKIGAIETYGMTGDVIPAGGILVAA